MSGVMNILRRPGDIVHKPLSAIGGLASDLLPLAGMGALGTGAKSFLGHNSWLGALDTMGGGGHGGFGDLLGGGGGQGGFGGGGYTGMNPDIAALFRSPFGQNLLYGDPLKQGGEGYGAGLGIGNGLRDAGNNLLYKGMNGLPGFGDMGALGNVPGVMDQQARMAGVASPFGTFGGSSDPYSLDPASQSAYTNQANMINQSRDSQVSDMRNHMMANGVTDPRTLAAMEAQIHSAHDQQANTLHSNMMQNSFNTRMNTLQGFNSNLGNLYNSQFGQQQSNIGHGAQMLEGAGGLYGQGTNQAIHMNDLRDTSLGHLLGLGLGGHGYGAGGYGGQSYGLPPLNAGGGGGGWMKPWESGYDTGAGNPGGVGPMPQANPSYDFSTYGQYDMPMNGLGSANWMNGINF